MLSWIKNLFKSPKTFGKMVVDSLDFAVPFIASEIEKMDQKFDQMSALQKSQFIVDKVQAYLTKQLKLDA